MTEDDIPTIIKKLREPWAYAGTVSDRLDLLEKRCAEREAVIAEQGRVIEAQIGHIARLDSCSK